MITNDIEFVFSLHHKGNHLDSDKIQQVNARWCQVQHFGDNFVLQPENLLDCEIILLHKNIWLKNYRESLSSDKKKVFDQLINGIEVIETGYYKYQPNNQDVVYKKYSISPNKNILLYLALDSPDLLNISNIWVKIWFKYFFYHFNSNSVFVKIIKVLGKFKLIHPKYTITEKELLMMIKKYCKANNMLLVVKARLKTPFIKLQEYADHVFYDETNYPSTVHELLSISTMLVSFGSMGTLDGIAYKNICLNINIPGVSEVCDAYFNRIFVDGSKEIFSSNGISYDIGSDDIQKWLLNNKISDLEKRKNNKLFDKIFNKYLGEFSLNSIKKIIMPPAK